MPAFCRMACAASVIGSANGSFTWGYAAVFGRSLAGSAATQSANGTSWSAIGGLGLKMFGRFSWETDGPPPAPSGYAYPYRAATFAAGTVSSVENGPKTRDTCSWAMSLV